MPRGLRLIDWLVRRRNMTRRDAAELISSGRILFNGKIPDRNHRVEPVDEIRIDGEIVKSAVPFVYIKCYKPVGIECTLNPEIPDNLFTIFPAEENIFPIGRLDKASEGLLLMTNDGRLTSAIASSESKKEKEYEVEIDRPFDEDFLSAMRSGVIIMGKKTRPATVEAIDATTFRIILTQGLNRQIRRMCYKLGYTVVRLKRTRMVQLQLGDLKPGERRTLDEAEKNALLAEI
jgi:23S rRNA pseudouridine2604 synthase